MINKIEFSARNLTSNAGLFLLLEHANNEFAISIKEPETVSRFLGNFSHKTTHMLLEECYATRNQLQSLQKAA